MMRRASALGFLWPLLSASACNSSNQNPELVSFNGREPRSFLGILFFEEPFYFVPGEATPLEVEARDPDGDPLQIWFAYQPPGLCFDPAGTEGVWQVPVSYGEKSTTFSLVLADDSDPMGISSVELSFVNMNPDWDTGAEWGWDTAWKSISNP